jgi:FkbM family methyltransferase
MSPSLLEAMELMRRSHGNGKLFSMLALPRRIIKKVVSRMGYELRPVQEFGANPFQDMLRLTQLGGLSHGLTIFDVGANIGDTVNQFHSSFPDARIHAFEPSPATYERLMVNRSQIPGITLNNTGLGATDGERAFHESRVPEMSSFLEPDKDCWAELSEDSIVRLATIDSYCASRNISRIDILKSDTQGYEMEVLRGAERMLTSGSVYLIYMEIIFSEMYKGVPGFDQIFRFLYDRGFRLVTFYRFAFQNHRAGWTDALFASDRFTGAVPGNGRR